MGNSIDTPSFGNGEVGGDRSYTAPVYGTTEDGRDVTVSFGRDGTRQEGQTLIANGHVSGKDFYSRDENGRSNGHDHADGKGNMTSRTRPDGSSVFGW